VVGAEIEERSTYDAKRYRRSWSSREFIAAIAEAEAAVETDERWVLKHPDDARRGHDTERRYSS